MMVCNKDLRIIFKAVYMFLAGSVHFQVKIDISTTPLGGTTGIQQLNVNLLWVGYEILLYL